MAIFVICFQAERITNGSHEIGKNVCGRVKNYAGYRIRHL